MIKKNGKYWVFAFCPAVHPPLLPHIPHELHPSPQNKGIPPRERRFFPRTTVCPRNVPLSFFPPLSFQFVPFHVQTNPLPSALYSRPLPPIPGIERDILFFFVRVRFRLRIVIPPLPEDFCLPPWAWRNPLFLVLIGSSGHKRILFQTELRPPTVKTLFAIITLFRVDDAR